MTTVDYEQLAVNRLTKLLDWFDLEFWEVMFVVMLILFVIYVWRATKDPNSPIRAGDALCDEQTGKFSFKKLGGFVALVTSTWIVARAAAFGTLSTEALGLYLMTWAGVYIAMPVANAYADKLKAGVPSPPPQEIEKTTVVSQTETVKTS